MQTIERRPAAVPAGFAAPLLLLVSISSVQSGAAVAQRLFPRAHPGGVVMMRLGLAGLVLLAVDRPRLRGRSARDLAVVVLFGATLAAMNLSFYQAVERLPLGLAVTIELLGPLALAAAMARRGREVAWTALAIVGVVLLGETGGGIDGLGLLFALGAAACWAGYILLSREAGRRFAGLHGLTLALLVGLVVSAPVGIAQAGSGLLSPTVLLAGAGVALLSALVPFSLEIVVLRRTPPRVFGVLMSLSPVAATISGYVFLGQRLGAVQLVAIGCVIAASAGTVAGTGQ